MKISLIVAAADNGTIGLDNDLPWYLPNDLKRFKALTTGHHVLMGRKTHASILARLGKPLPNRTSLVISRDPSAPARFGAEGCQVFDELEDALAFAREHGERELFVIGGAAIYEQLLDRADRVHLTEVHAQVEGDTALPPFERDSDTSAWVEVDREDRAPDDRHEHAYSFVTLERRTNAGHDPR